MEYKDLSFDDKFLKKAFKLFLEEGNVSASFLQRKLMIGYSRAARIVDTLEYMNLISPIDENRTRKLLVTKEQIEDSFEASLDSILGDDGDDDIFDRIISVYKMTAEKELFKLNNKDTNEKETAEKIEENQEKDVDNSKNTQIFAENHRNKQNISEKYDLNDIKIYDESENLISNEAKNWLFDCFNDAVNSNEYCMNGHYFCPRLTSEELNKIIDEIKSNKAVFKLYSAKDEKEIDNIDIKNTDAFLNVKNVWVFVKINDLLVSEFEEVINKFRAEDKNTSVSFVIDLNLEYKYELGVLLV